MSETTGFWRTVVVSVIFVAHLRFTRHFLFPPHRVESCGVRCGEAGVWLADVEMRSERRRRGRGARDGDALAGVLGASLLLRSRPTPAWFVATLLHHFSTHFMTSSKQSSAQAGVIGACLRRYRCDTGNGSKLGNFYKEQNCLKCWSLVTNYLLI